MTPRRRFRTTLALSLLLTALIPVAGALYFSRSIVQRASERFYMPEVGERLDQSLGLYQELARAVKASMRAEGAALALDPELRRAVSSDDVGAARARLEHVFPEHPTLVSLTVERAHGTAFARVDRGRPLDAERENALEVIRPLDPGDADESGPRLVALFAADKARFEGLASMSQFVDEYREIERRRVDDQSTYLHVYAAILGLTIVLAIGVGTLLARGVTTRVERLAAATRRVGGGDLDVRVAEQGQDELGDLARAFNRMLGEVADSRARVEYLQRIGAWQEMARRLAHEIKNPLTPIQLAVQEVHRRYSGEDPNFVKLLDTTLEVVEDEVGTLRRLVGEFSDFARLPQAKLEASDLKELLLDQQRRLALGSDDQAEHETPGPPLTAPLVLEGVSVELDLPSGPAPASIDRQMFRRVLVNLVRNAQQAITQSGKGGRVVVALAPTAGGWRLSIDDDGPGIPAEIQATLFDPYVTTKTDGTGLGLAIVKKIVIEHGGGIEAKPSALGGACFAITLPRAFP